MYVFAISQQNTFTTSNSGRFKSGFPQVSIITTHVCRQVLFSVVSVCLSVCLSVCVSVCVSVCPSVCPYFQTITFESLDIETLFLVCRYILTISRSSLSIKVIGSLGQGHMRKNDNFTYFNFLILCMWIQVINKVKVTHQGQGHIKIKVKYLHPFNFYVAYALYKRVVCIRLKCYLFNEVYTFQQKSAILNKH